jgi:hypothetical protein
MDAGSRGTTLAARERLEAPQKPTQELGFPHQPHFQTEGAGCREGHWRASRIRNSIAEGTAGQAKARALGLRWAWIFGLRGRRGVRQPPQVT